MPALARALLVALPLALAAGTAQAQRVTGTLRDEASGQAVASATVVVINGRGWEKGRTLSDAAGAFALKLPARGAYWVRVEREGYHPAESRPFVVAAADSVALDLALAPRATMLEGVTVTATRRQNRNLAGFLNRQRFGWGRYLGPEEVARRRATRASQFLWSVPGFVFGPRGGVLYTGRGSRCAPTVVVDGFSIPPEEGVQNVDLLVSAAEIRAVEIYRVGDPAPLELRISSGGCGAIVFWTDHGLGA